MRRTATLRLYILDSSFLARNMYELLFQGFPGFHLEFGKQEDLASLADRQRRARPHIVLINSNSLSRDEQPQFLDDYPAILLASPDRMDLKEFARERDKVVVIEKPFYPYDLITVINRVASAHHPLSRSLDPAPAPRRRRFRHKKGKEAR